MRRVGVVVIIAGLLGASASLAIAKPKTRLVSKTSQGQAGDDSSSDQAISDNGRIIVFQSIADNLPGPDDVQGIYAHDRRTGRTRLVSRTPNGQPATGQNRSPGVSGNGRFVVFESDASNLPGEGFQVYVHDRKTRRTRLASKNSAGVPADNSSLSAGISDSGRFVTFRSMAGNLPAGPSALSQLYIRDRKTRKTRLLSKASDGTPVNAGLYALSSTARFVAFTSSHPSLPGASPGTFHVYVRDRTTKKTRLVSKTSSGQPLEDSSVWVDLSADGRVVVFTQNVDVQEICHTILIYAHDRATKKTRLVSRNSAGDPADGCSELPSISGDGRYVAFQSDASNLPGSSPPFVRSYLHDRKTRKTRVLSRATGGAVVSGSFPRLSGSGLWVAFGSSDPALPGPDMVSQVYVRGRLG